MKRFATDTDLVAELSVPVLSRLFDACVQYWIKHHDGKEGKMSLGAFELALVMICMRVYKRSSCTNASRLALLFLRMSTAGAARDLGLVAHSLLGTQIPSSLPPKPA